MKKYILTIAAVFALSLAANAVTTNENGQIIETYTNAFGYVMDIVIGQAGSTTVPTEIPYPGTVVIGTAAPTATPSQLGQVAIDRGDAAYIAVGGTSSDWVGVPQFVVLDSTTLGAEYNLTNRTPSVVGEFVYAVSNVLSATTGVGTTGSIAVATTLLPTGWVIVK